MTQAQQAAALLTGEIELRVGDKVWLKMSDERWYVRITKITKEKIYWQKGNCGKLWDWFGGGYKSHYTHQDMQDRLYIPQSKPPEEELQSVFLKVRV